MLTPTGSGTCFSTKINGRDGYLARITLRNSLTGERISITGSGATRKQAIARRDANLARRLQREEEKGNITNAEATAKATPPPKGSKGRSAGITAREFTPIWLQAKGNTVKPQTKRTYETVLENHFLPTFGDRPLKSITSLELTIYANNYLPDEKGLSNNTIHHVLNIVKDLLGQAERYGYIKDNPAKEIKRKKTKAEVHREDERYLNKRTNILRGLLKEIAEPDHPHHENHLLIMLMSLGLRRAETLGLEWSSFTGLKRANHCKITIDRQLINVPDEGFRIQHGTKAPNSERTFYLPEAIRKALLERQREERANANTPRWAKDAVFLTKKGGAPNYEQYRTAWTKTLHDYMSKNGRKPGPTDHWRGHSNRKIAASLLASQGVPITIAADILGHDQELYKYYAIVQEKDRQNALLKLSEALGLGT